MDRRVRAIVLTSVAAALLVFAVVQDRVTAAGAERYAELQRAALAAGASAVAIDEVMRPAVARSVRQGLIWGGMVLVAGLGLAAVAARRDAGE
ncbi:MAG: hypothetical protein HYY76_10460 [Acidobacteria bacterium]|nr:hypothetical protein [Acidobacteriota bacterium]